MRALINQRWKKRKFALLVNQKSKKMELKIGLKKQMCMMVHILEPFKLMIMKYFIKKIKIAILPISLIIEKTWRKHNIITSTAPTQWSMYYFVNLLRIQIPKTFKKFRIIFDVSFTFIRYFSDRLFICMRMSMIIIQVKTCVVGHSWDRDNLIICLNMKIQNF